MFDSLFNALPVALQFGSVVSLFVGTLVGILIGALPGSIRSWQSLSCSH